MRSYEKKRVELLVYGLLLVVASLPLACAYIMQGGNIMLWLSRVEEAASADGFCLFPSLEALVPYSERISAVNSNLLLYIPAIFRKIGMSVTSSYRMYMLILQIITVLSARAFFKEVFKDDITAFIGTVLWITCPYRIYVNYDSANLGIAAALALTTAYGWSMVKLCNGEKNWKVLGTAVISLTGIAYSDMIVFAVVFGFSSLGYIIFKGWIGLLCSAGSCMLSAPALIYMIRYLVKGNLEQYSLPLDSIAVRGYSLGQLFSTFAYRSNFPGIGIGLFGAAAVMFCLMVRGDVSFKTKAWRCTFAAAFLMLFASTAYFPWDFAQRVAGLFHRFVSLIGSPNVFMGFASLFISIPAAYAVGSLKKQQGKFVQYGIMILILLLAIGSAIWHCNTLTYTRPPMFLIDSL